MDRILECYEGEVGSDRMIAEARERIDWLVEHVEDGPVLDLGCSQGLLGMLLARKGIGSRGLDIDAEAVAFAQSRAEDRGDEIREHVRFEVTDAAEFVSGNLSEYKVIVVSLLLDQLEDPSGFLAQLSRNASSDARILIQVDLGVRGDKQSALYPFSLVKLLDDALKIESLEVVGDRIAVVASPDPELRHSYPIDASFCSFVEAALAAKDREQQDEILRLRKRNKELQVASAELARFRRAKIRYRKEAESLQEKLDDALKAIASTGEAEDANWRKLAVERRWELVNAKTQNEKLQHDLQVSREKLEAKQDFILKLQEKLATYRSKGEN